MSVQYHLTIIVIIIIIHLLQDWDILVSFSSLSVLPKPALFNRSGFA